MPLLCPFPSSANCAYIRRSPVLFALHNFFTSPATSSSQVAAPPPSRLHQRRLSAKSSRRSLSSTRGCISATSRTPLRWTLALITVEQHFFLVVAHHHLASSFHVNYHIGENASLCLSFSVLFLDTTHRAFSFSVSCVTLATIHG